MPCSGTTSGAGSKAVITPSRVTPPAIPRIPEIVAVTKQATTNTRTVLVSNIHAG
jgi:hypothetical protein